MSTSARFVTTTVALTVASLTLSLKETQKATLLQPFQRCLAAIRKPNR